MFAVWSSNGVLQTNFTNWNEGEPNNAVNGEDCVETTHLGNWNDLDCEEYKPFICKFDEQYDVTTDVIE